jgi:hypothetical protein
VDVANLILLIIATLASVVAAIFAIRADVFGRASGQLAATQRKADIQPHLTVTWQGAPANGCRIMVGNGGGAAPHLYWVGHDEAAIFITCGVIPAHVAPVLVGVLLVPNVAYPDPGIATTVVLAEDIQGGRYGIDGKPVPESAETYVRTELEKVGLSPDARDRILDALRLA